VETFDPFDLDLDGIYARLSFQASAQRLPPNWRPWKQPSPPLPIDEFITELIERRRAPKMRAPAELARYHPMGLCPYGVARAELARASLNALLCVDTERHRVTATAEIMLAAKGLPGLRAEIAAMVDRLMLISEAQEYAFDQDLEGVPLIEHADNLAAVRSELQKLEEPLTRLYMRRSQTNVNANVWRISFAGFLFGAWWRLTGSDPSTTEPFTKFLDRAWQTLTAGRLPDLPWESAIGTARTRARLEHGSEAPWRIADCHLDPALSAQGMSV
jgi:hypothetical protein